MREILFKAKRIDNGEWVVGNIIELLGKAYIFYGRNGNFNVSDVGALSKQVYIETISQYTGLKDKNGSEIFENDIVKIQINNNTDNEEFICEVQYSHLAFDFRRINGNEDKGCVVFARNIIPPNNYEIIGNQFDNPELLGNAEKVEK